MNRRAFLSALLAAPAVPFVPAKAAAIPELKVGTPFVVRMDGGIGPDDAKRIVKTIHFEFGRPRIDPNLHSYFDFRCAADGELVTPTKG